MRRSEGLREMLGLSGEPFAIGYFSDPPAGIEPYGGEAVPAGCSFWRLAREGRSFYTEAPDHYNCAVGIYTHGIDLPAEREGELGETVGFMVEAGYLRLDEVPGIPKLAQAPQFIAYGPAGNAGFEAHVVIVAARPAQAMLLYEAAVRAGLANGTAPVLGRPGCAIEPFTLSSGKAGFSFGCIGNRTFTGLGDDEMYVSFPGGRWPDVVAAVEAITAANRCMEDRYRQHGSRFSD